MGLEWLFDQVYYRYRASSIGQHLLLAYGNTFDDVLIVPRMSLVSRHSVDTTAKLTNNIKLKIPLISSNMDTVTGPEMAIAIASMGGIGFIYRLTSTIEEEAKMVHKVVEKGYMVGASVGVKGDFMERADAVIKAGATIIVFDIANGYSEQMATAIITFKKKYPSVPIVAGNVATPGGVEFLAKLGVDCIKVGIGPGAVCTTRIVTGHGVPQLSAIYRCAKKAKEYNIPIIADGGIRTSGDICKALAAGASTVMLGSLLSGTLESPGGVYTVYNGDEVELLEPEKLDDYKNIYKIYRGMSSESVQVDAQKRKLREKTDIIPEGVTKKIQYKGPVKPILEQLIGGLRSGLSYSKSKTIEELQKNAIFEKITTAGKNESVAHVEEFKHNR